ncbi:50S ribosomal protein L32 [Candidatus Parcubacteria bacterium]|nr:MAG: 50S ribosomal protein L32 [Candidatus Parcubacteria bacterium]
MSVPKKRRTSSSVGRRRSHHALKTVSLIKCSKCGKSVEPHKACSFCGTYREREIIKIKEKTAKSEK